MCGKNKKREERTHLFQLCCYFLCNQHFCIYAFIYLLVVLSLINLLRQTPGLIPQEIRQLLSLIIFLPFCLYNRGINLPESTYKCVQDFLFVIDVNFKLSFRHSKQFRTLRSLDKWHIHSRQYNDQNPSREKDTIY